MKDRIRKIMEQSEMTQNDFAQYLDISPSTLSSIFNGRTNPTNNIVKAIHENFPDIELDWLMFNEGNMYKSKTAETSTESTGTLTEIPAGSGACEPDLFAASSAAAEGLSAHPSLQGQPFSGAEASRKSGNAIPPHATQSSALPPASQGLAQTIEVVKYIDKPKRLIKEIRVFYDDGTYESFIPG